MSDQEQIAAKRPYPAPDAEPCPECAALIGKKSIARHRRVVHGWRKPTAAERFFAKVNKRGPDECWEWQARTDKVGYGRFSPDSSRLVAAHRWSYEHATGETIPEGMLILHSCDNPPCVNPAHLRVGTSADNAADREARGRGRRPKRRSEEAA